MALFLLTTTLGLMTYNAGELLKPLFGWAYRTSSMERVLLTQKTNLKHDQSQFSMVDEFAKYSKLQRKINSIDTELVDLQSRRLRNNLIVRMLCTYVVRFVLGLVLMYLGISYRNTPLFHVSKRFDFLPFSSVISYPNVSENSVSVPFWIMCCTTVGSLIKIGV